MYHLRWCIFRHVHDLLARCFTYPFWICGRSAWPPSLLYTQLGFPFAKILRKFCERMGKFFLSLRQHFAQSLANFMLRKIALFRFCVIMFWEILRNKFSVNCINQLSLRLHFFAYNCNAFKGNDYLRKSIFSNLMDNGILEIKMCTISNESPAEFFALLNLSQKQPRSIIKMYMSRPTK